MPPSDYQDDDFYDENFDSYPNSPAGRRPLHRNNNQEDEENDPSPDDEQVQQKLNERIETLAQRVEDLEGELEEERNQNLKTTKRYEEEIKLAWNSQTKAEEEAQQSTFNEQETIKELKKELAKYRKENEQLKDKVELLMITKDDDGDEREIDSTTTHHSVPHSLEEEFHKYCRQNDIFPDFKEKYLSVENCLSILAHANAVMQQTKTESKQKKKKKSISSQSIESKEDHQEDAEPSEANPSQEKDKTTSSRGGKLVDRIKALELELRASSMACDSDHMKQKVFQLSERIRVEKETKRMLEHDVAIFKKKIEMLSDHIEKLVSHLKREGANKVRLAEQLRISEREGQRIREKADIIQRKSSAKDRLILELREGSKVLEDQLRLMDEKYLELRGKLDYARSMAWKKIKKAEKEASDLRVKFAMTGNSQLLLDTSMRHSHSQPLPTNTNFEDFDADSWNSDNFGFAPGGGGDSPTNQRRGSGRLKGPNSKSRTLTGMHISFDSSVQQSKATTGTRRSEPSMDVVLEKIRVQSGSQQVWTEEKAKKLTLKGR